MPATKILTMFSSPGRRWLATAVLMALAYLATREYVSLFLGVEFIFGSIFTFTALKWLGLGRALLVALAAGAFTVTHWGHPYALLTLVAECLFVGTALKKRPERNLPIWTLYFWLAIGYWVILLSYRYALGLPWSAAGLVATKQAINEVCSALIATLAFQLYRMRQHAQDEDVEAPVARNLLVNIFSTFAIVPALVVVVINGRNAVLDAESMVRLGIGARQRSISVEVQAWQSAILHRLEVLSRKGSALEPREIRQFVASNHELLFVHVLDASGNIRLSTDEDSTKLKNINFADRPWFSALVSSKQPVVSDVLIGRTTGITSVALAVPILEGGRLVGAVLTSVNGVTALGKVAPGSSLPGDRVTLLDRRGTVISSTEPDNVPGQPFASLARGVITDSAENTYRLRPKEMSSAVEGWLGSYLAVESSEAEKQTLHGWSIVAERPLKPYVLALQMTNLQSLAAVFVLFIIAAGLADYAGRLIAQPFQRLAQAMSDFAQDFGRGSMPKLPRGGVKEIRQLSIGFRRMAHEVADSYEKVRQARDLLELRVAQRTAELQQRQKALDEHAIVSITDASGTITYVNDKFVEISGYTRDELLGKNHRLLNSGYHDVRFFAEMWKEISHGQPWHGQICNRSKRGDFYWVESTIVPFFDSYGLITQYVSIRTDITKNKEIEVELIKSREEAERASNAKSEFLSSMSHELRTPLNAVLGFAQLLQFDEELSPDSKEGVHEILKAGDHLLTLINEVLDLAKIESGHMDISLEPVAIEPVILESFDLLDRLAAAHGVRLILGQTENMVVRADRVRLKQIFLNLLSNGIKYNRRGGTLTVEASHPEPGRVWIRVVDTGPGIAAEKIAELFKPFHRLGAENGPVEGAGIGLVITQRLVELMGGSVGVESRLGEGSTFWVELQEERNDTVLTSAEPLAFALRADERSRAHTVLYIEDNPSNLKLVSQILGRRPHIHLLTAHAPRLGVDLARTRSPDLILLDINMPDMDGYEVLRVIRSQAELERIPVIAVTANAAPKDIRRGLEAGFNDYVIKPIDVAKLLAVVDHYLFEDKTS